MVELEFTATKMKGLPSVTSGKWTGSVAAASWSGVGIKGNQKTELVIVEGNLNAKDYTNTLGDHLLPFMRNHGPQAIFQQDNSRPWYCQSNHRFLGKQLCQSLTPAVSPYPCPIE